MKLNFRNWIDVFEKLTSSPNPTKQTFHQVETRVHKNKKDRSKDLKKLLERIF